MAIYNPRSPFKKSSKFAIRNDPKNPDILKFHKGEDYAAPIKPSMATKSPIFQPSRKPTIPQVQSPMFGLILII
jgi:hypothetical protein